MYALQTPEIEPVMERAVDLVASTLGADLVEVLALRADGAELLLRAVRGWNAGSVGTAAIRADASTHAGFTLAARDPVVVADFQSESRFGPSPLLVEHAAMSGGSVIIHAPGPAGKPWGLLAAYWKTPADFPTTT